MNRLFLKIALPVASIAHLASAAPSLESLSLLERQISVLPEKTLRFMPTYLTLDQLRASIATYRAQRMIEQRNAAWISTRPSNGLFAQKLIVPQNSTVLFFGDIHGSIHSIVRMLDSCTKKGILNDQLVITQPDTYFVFLGDYVDRGFYSVETLNTLLQFAIKNPGKVILLRGNHEDEMMNRSFGFGQELATKFPEMAAGDSSLIYRLFDLMPSVLYLGAGENNRLDIIQCCHGGIEIGFNPQKLLEHTSYKAFQSIDRLERASAIRALPQGLKKPILDALPAEEICSCSISAPTSPTHLGFLWNDFIEKDNLYTSSAIGYKEDRGWVLGKMMTKHFLGAHSTQNAYIRTIFRAHQHHGTMLEMIKEGQGIVPLWNGLVYTFVSSPITAMHIQFDSYGILKIGKSFDEWKMKHCVITKTGTSYTEIPRLLN
ncbi:MAG TPA: metallophosphoesterase family protein [Candidatus Babeliales bacterium]|nr:metallophosphoesterase family protein [Candidatus Babeliales bacterium]